VAESVSGVELRRWLATSPESVFRAFTDPALLVRWFSPSPDIATRVLEHDLREGGRYRFAFRFPDGAESVVLGEFLEVSRPLRLVFTWTWENPDPHAGVETRVTLTLTPESGGTSLLVTHDGFPEEGIRHRHDEGWAATLARLSAILQTS
jgi:uncharacterized protein YndB with AHSA1/START domain